MDWQREIKRVVPHGLWSGLRLIKSKLTLARFPARVVEHQVGNTRVKIFIADPLAEAWYDHDWEEPPEITLLKQSRLKRGSRVFDVGAHQGIVALMLAEAVGPEGLVIAVEANPHNAAVAERNKQLNNVEHCKVRNLAVAEKKGRIKINLNLNSAIDDRGGWAQHEVDAVTIDDLKREYGAPDILYLDIEGYECRALSGATETLSTRPDCFVEVHVGCGLEGFGGSVEQLLIYFPVNHYSLYMSSDSSPEFVPFDSDSPIVRDRFYLLAVNTQP